MEIKDLKPKQGNVEVLGEVIEKGDIREFEKFGKSGKVCNAKLKDSSGEVKLSLWNEQIDQVNVGDTVKVTNGYASEWQGEIQLTTGKFGNLEIVGAGEAKPESKTDEGEQLPPKENVTEESQASDEKVESSASEDSMKVEEEEIQ